MAPPLRRCAVFAVLLQGLLLVAVIGDSPAHRWNPDHRALWAANVAGGRDGAAEGVRGPAKRHAGARHGGRGGHAQAWVPGSRMPLYHYPADRREVRADDPLQYMEGADTVVSMQRVRPPGGTEPQRDWDAAPGGAPGPPGGRRRKGDGRRLRHHRQRHHQVQPSGQDPGPAPRPPPPRAGNVTTVLRTVQRGSAVVRAPGAPGAPGPAVPVHPDPSKTQRSLVQRPILPPAPRQPGTPLVPANLMQPAAPPYLRPGSAPERAPAAVAPSCPSDKTVLAPKGQDYVLMDKLTTSDGAPLDVIAGPRPGDPVPEGPHPVVGRLVSGSGGSGGRPSSLCRLTYSVMVRRCGPPPPLSTTSRAAPRGAAPRCTAGTAWGSRCHYRCPRRGLQLRGNSWVQCGDDLRWVGRPPVCAERARPHPAVVLASTEAPRRSCPVPALPEHGVASCRARPKAPDGGHHQDDDGDEESNDAQRLAEGSECTVSCRPPHQLLLIRAAADAANAVTPEKAVMRCGAGLWNVTGWSCARGEALDADLDGDISAVLADAGSSLQDEWDWRENSVMDPCLPNPCHSGGTCLRGPPKSKAVCQCRPGTEGDLCDRVLCRGTCLHGGRCLLLNGQPSCFCRAGYAGSRCQAPVRNVRYPVPTVPGVGSSGGGLPTLPTAPTTSSTSTTPTSPASAPLTKP